MAGLLSAYLADVACRPFVWHEDDCARFAAEWAERACGRPVWPAVAALYSDEASFRKLSDSRGGMMGVVREILAPLGWTETAFPVSGDIGVVRVAGVEMMGIYSAGGWIVRLREGVSRPRHPQTAGAMTWRP